MYPVLRTVLNKGGAGRSISRAESVERIVPFVTRQLELLKAYDGATSRLSNGVTRQRMEEVVLPNLRTELNKLYETVFSLGGAAPTGAEMEWTGSALSGGDDDVLRELIELDQAFSADLREEIDAVHHQERVRAILGHNAGGSDDRVAFVRRLVNA